MNLFPLNLIWLTELNSRIGISELIYQNFQYLNSRIKNPELIYQIIDDLNSRYKITELDSLNLFKLNLIEPPLSRISKPFSRSQYLFRLYMPLTIFILKGTIPRVAWISLSSQGLPKYSDAISWPNSATLQTGGVAVAMGEVNMHVSRPALSARR